jgi:transposase-like protein
VSYAPRIGVLRESITAANVTGLAFPAEVIHLVLRGRHPDALVQHEEDWRVLSCIVERMLFWCGGSIHGCRCEGNEMRFALETAHAPISAVVRHLVSAYSSHLRRRGRTGRLFKHYIATALDAELYLDELVLWLHRPAQRADCWTTDRAYRIPDSLSWVTTGLVLGVLGGWNGSGYRRRMGEAVPPATVAALTRSSATGKLHSGDSRRVRATPPSPVEGSSLDRIVEMVATYHGVSRADMLSGSRRRSVSKARMIAAVLSARRGASVAEVARLFGRSRSTLIEQAEHYRKTQPQLFEDAEQRLHAFLDAERTPSPPLRANGLNDTARWADGSTAPL